jgi:predicted RNA-binding Zn ribbon-like protein
MPDPEFILLGDALWLEFVNTLMSRPGQLDALPDAAAWLRWTKAVRVEAPDRPGGFAEAREFRAQLAGLARALDAGGRLPPSAIEAVNTRLAALDGREQLVRVGGAWRLRFAPGRLPSALEAVAQSAARTLAAPVATVRRCANPDCGLYLLDESPSQSRRWCSPSRCGQRGRIERRRGTRPPTPLLAEG